MGKKLHDSSYLNVCIPSCSIVLEIVSSLRSKDESRNELSITEFGIVVLQNIDKNENN